MIETTDIYRSIRNLLKENFPNITIQEKDKKTPNSPCFYIKYITGKTTQDASEIENTDCSFEIIYFAENEELLELLEIETKLKEILKKPLHIELTNTNESEKQNQYQGKEKNNVVYEEELYKDENIVISYNKITENSYGGYDIDFVIENYSSRTLEVQARETSINGYMVDPICSIEIAPNKKAVDGMSIGGVDAERVPLKEISDIETKFHIIDWNDDAFNYDTGNITIKRND